MLSSGKGPTGLTEVKMMVEIITTRAMGLALVDGDN